MKKTILITTLILLLTIKVKAQFYTSAMNLVDTSWSVLLTNSPTSVHPNRYNIIQLDKRGIHFKNKRVFWDTVGIKPTNLTSGAKIMFLNGIEMLSCPKDSIRWSIGSITNLTNSLSLKYDASNPSGFISSYTETDPIFLVSPSFSITGSNISNWNTAYGWGSHTGLYYPLSGNPSGFLTSVPAQSFSSLTGKPTTLSGYGITDAYPLTGNPSNFLTSEVDGNITNELQTLSGTGTNTLVLSAGGGTFVIPTPTITNNVYDAGYGITKSGTEPTATLSINQTDIMTVNRASDSITNIKTSINGKVPNSRTITIGAQTFDLSANRTFTVVTNNNQLTNGAGYLTSFTEVDGSTTNEIQTLSRTGNTITLTSGGSVTLTPVTDSQTLSISSNTLSISGGNSIVLPSSTNPTLSISSNSLSISGGNTVTLPVVGITAGNGISINQSTGIYSISVPTRTMSTVTRSLNVSYTISATSDYNVNYSIYAQVTSALAGTNTADVYLEIAAPATPTVFTVISRSGISVAGVLSTSGNTQTVGGFIPAGYYVRLRTVATGLNMAAAVFTYQNGQENSY